MKWADIRNRLVTIFQSKIHITVILPPPNGVVSTTTPKVVSVEKPPLVKRHKSSFRFVEEKKIDHDGSERMVYLTEECKNGNWVSVFQSICTTKEEAMNLHLKLIERGNLNPETSRTVLWEGLDHEEAKVWVELHS